MIRLLSLTTRAALSAALAFALIPALPASAAVSVVVNGSPVTFDQPPIERGGRVFVALRGVFERLGASVVYGGGLINASGNGRNISLRIGSTTATVNGAPQTLDVAPFLVGARTLVPLRFVSQALGANVDYNSSNQTVSVTMGGAPAAPAAYVPPPAPAATAYNTVTLQNVRPGEYTEAKSPLIAATFSEPVNPNSVEIDLDGRNVSSTTEISSAYFTFTPPYELSPEKHTVTVRGKAQSGAPFERSFAFTSGTAAPTNFLNNITPPDGTKVGASFVLEGNTIPNSRVKLTAIGAQNVGGAFRITTAAFTTEVSANANGHFAIPINSADLGAGGLIGLRIITTAPGTGASITKTETISTR